MINVIASSPLGSSYSSVVSTDLTRYIQGYTHDINVFGGYNTARIDLSVNEVDVQAWIESGIGRHIVAFYNGATVWEGFVDKVSVNFGALQLGVGPLTEICNRVYAKYADFTTNVPTLTATAEDTASQAKYGIRSKVISVGQVSSTTAEKIRDTYLEENKRPKISQNVSTSNNFSLTLECSGYYKMLEYNYFNAGSTTYTLREKIIDVLFGEPNSIFSTDYTDMEANSLSVFELEVEGRKGLDVIKELVNMGDDATNAKAAFGIYNNRKARYAIDTGLVKYTQRLREGNVVRSISGQIVDLHNIQPGYWLRFTDLMFLSSQDAEPEAIDNPSLMYIESVTFTAPNQISIVSGDAESLPRRLAKLGLAGIS